MNQVKYTVSFRPANTLDIEFLLVLRKLSMTEHLANAGIHMTDEQHMSRVNEFFEDSNIIMLNKEPIGVLKLGELDASIHIRQFQLLPVYQGKGIGTRVLNVVKRKAESRSKPITLCVLLANPAKNLYLKQGFEIERSDELQHYMRFY